MSLDRLCGWPATLAGTLALAVAVVLGGCGGGDENPATTPGSTQTAPATANGKARSTADRGTRRCSRAALLAALLADVDLLAFKVDRVRCKGNFARSRFVARGCVPGQATKVPCDRAKVAAWRLGAKRWRLITYAEELTCDVVRRAARDFPRTLCD